MKRTTGTAPDTGAIVALQPSATLDSGTFDLQPDGSPAATRFARYRIVSGDMWVVWGPIRPGDLSGASLYSTAAP